MVPEASTTTKTSKPSSKAERWYLKGPQHYSEIKWVPQEVPTMIVGGNDDLITPSKIFLSDSKFRRDNIEMVNIEAAGHFPWIEKPQIINSVLTSFINKCEYLD